MSERRRQYYTDQILQGYLLVGLILLEVLLVCLLVYFLYAGINQILEDQMYLIHKKTDSSLPEIFNLLFFALSGFVATNLAALYVAHLIWGRYIKNTINVFSMELDKINAHEFAPVTSANKTHHHMITLMDDWMLKEKNRKSKTDSLLRRLSEITEVDSDEELKAVRGLLNDYQNALPARRMVSDSCNRSLI